MVVGGCGWGGEEDSLMTSVGLLLPFVPCGLWCAGAAGFRAYGAGRLVLGWQGILSEVGEVNVLSMVET